MSPREPGGLTIGQIERVGLRLGTELRAMLRALPIYPCTVKAMSAYLAINRGVCQRIELAVRASGSGLEVIRRLPGVDGLRSVVRAVAERLTDAAARQRLLAAFSEYVELVESAGGTQARLWRAMDTLSSAAETERVGTDGARRSMYEAARQIAGVWARTTIGITIVRPMPEAPGMLETARAQGYLGLRRQAGGLPVVWRQVGMRGGEDTTTFEGQRGSGTQWSSLMAEFCTPQLPLVTCRAEPGYVEHAADGDLNAREPSDLVIGTRNRPAGAMPAGMRAAEAGAGPTDWSLHFGPWVRVPTERLMLDLWVPRSFGSSVACVANALVSGAGASEVTPQRVWQDRLEHALAIQEAEFGGPVSVGGYERHGELLRRVFAHVNADPAEFRGWRLEASWPIWGAHYNMTIANRGADQASEPEAI